MARACVDCRAKKRRCTHRTVDASTSPQTTTIDAAQPTEAAVIPTSLAATRGRRQTKAKAEDKKTADTDSEGIASMAAKTKAKAEAKKAAVTDSEGIASIPAKAEPHASPLRETPQPALDNLNAACYLSMHFTFSEELQKALAVFKTAFQKSTEAQLASMAEIQNSLQNSPDSESATLQECLEAHQSTMAAAAVVQSKVDMWRESWANGK
ncbi:uncharacterized protein N7511_006485 [Penicillium nucicola]|uniref:uncharacterized protein n=1 Tax=Penicillium nucicola TaxID=1850975 RepID=UPI002545426A|nr:uncharacterized protein N7511_006485 [Penicillium nucicola]KAJ5757791.1 hypothetical protein N7511_006485 [Penicillium nucicola]